MKQAMTSNPIYQIWDRMPLIIRAILGGFFVSSIGVAVWGGLLAIRFSPIAILPMIPALWVFWKFFSGDWGSASRSGIKRQNFRLTKLSSSVWNWGIAGALLFVVIFQSCLMITFRLIGFPRAIFMHDYLRVDTLPLWSALSIIVMSSLVAGIVEEAGFRGYMQQPLEKKYGSAPAIGLTSLIFTLVHLTHGWAQQIPLQIFFASILLGILAYKSNSLVPGIIGHSILDIFDYSVWWTDLFGGFSRETVFRTGIDLHFVVWVSIFLLGCFGFFRVVKHFPRGAGGEN